MTKHDYKPTITKPTRTECAIGDTLALICQAGVCLILVALFLFDVAFLFSFGGY